MAAATLAAGRRRILIIEDEPVLREMIGSSLREHAFDPVEAPDATRARQELAARRPSLVLLDLGLPDEDGVRLLGELTRDGVPVIVVSGRDTLADRVLGLELGADDYLAKPFDCRELVARINSVLRRASGPARRGAVEFGPLAIDADSHEVTLDGVPVELTAREFALLHFLARSPRRVWSPAQLLEHVWESSPSWQDPHTVSEHVHRIRRKLGTRDDGSHWIQTVRGVGYRFCPG